MHKYIPQYNQQVKNHKPPMVLIFKTFHIRDVGQIKPGNATTFGILNYLKNTRNIINMFLQTSIIILHEENTQKIMAVQEFVYLIQNHTHLHKL
jgi:hypothetical protein